MQEYELNDGLSVRPRPAGHARTSAAPRQRLPGWRWACLVLLLLLPAIAAGCEPRPNSTVDTEPPEVSVVVIAPALEEMARAVAGPRAVVTVLLSPGDRLAAYRPDAAALARINAADIVILNGSEPWQRTGATSELAMRRTVLLDDYRPKLPPTPADVPTLPGASAGAYLWLHPGVVALAAEGLAERLSGRYPDRRPEYFANAERFAARMTRLKPPSNLPTRVMLTDARFTPLLAWAGVSWLIEPAELMPMTPAEARRVRTAAQPAGLRLLVLPGYVPEPAARQIGRQTDLTPVRLNDLGSIDYAGYLRDTLPKLRVAE